MVLENYLNINVYVTRAYVARAYVIRACVTRAYVIRAYVARAYVIGAYVARVYVVRAYVTRDYVIRAFVIGAYVCFLLFSNFSMLMIKRLCIFFSAHINTSIFYTIACLSTYMPTQGFVVWKNEMFGCLM